MRNWIDIPVFILANVIVDIEVLLIGLLGLAISGGQCLSQRCIRVNHKEYLIMDVYVASQTAKG